MFRAGILPGSVHAAGCVCNLTMALQPRVGPLRGLWTHRVFHVGWAIANVLSCNLPRGMGPGVD